MTDIDERPRMNAQMKDRRTFLKVLGAGTIITALGATYIVVGDEATRKARKMKLPDGRPRLPPSQSLIQRLRPMGGQEGDPRRRRGSSRCTARCDNPFEIDFAGLLAMPQVDQTCDVHCVTKWSVLDANWTGVRVADLAATREAEVDGALRDLRGRRRLHRERPAPRGAARRTCSSRTSTRAIRCPARTARRCARSCPTLFLEEREVAHRHSVPRARPARLLGDARLPQPRRPVEGGAVFVTASA